jgi:AcrR family transcriptional regulator
MLSVSRSKSPGKPRAASKRGAYHHGDLRRALVQAGQEILAEQGVDGLSLREVARRAQVSQAAPYHHFADKAALVGAIVEEGFAGFRQALLASADEIGGGALQRFTGMGLAYVRFAVDNPALFRLLFRPELRGRIKEGAAAEAIEQAELGAYQVLLDAAQAAIDEGSVRGLSAEDVALSAWSMVHGLATLIVDGPAYVGGRPPDEMARIVLFALGAGFAG